MKLTMKSWFFGALSSSSLIKKVSGHEATLHDMEIDHGHRSHLRHLYDSYDIIGTTPFGRDLAATCPSTTTSGTCPIQIASSKWKKDACTSCYQGIGCTAGDLTYHSCRLVLRDVTEKCFSCECGKTYDVNIECIVENKTSSARLTAVAMGYFSNDGTTCGSSSCFTALCVDQPKDNPLQPNVRTTITFTSDSSKPIQWICGSQAQFKDIVLMSQPTSGSCLNLAQCGPKCDFFQTFPIQTPVGVNLNNPVCANGAQTFTLSGTLTGVPNFTVKIECSEAGAAGYPVTISNISTYQFSKSGLSPCKGGQLTVTATDSNTDGCTATATKAAPKCCFNAFECKEGSPVDRGQINGCKGSDNAPVKKEYTEVFTLNDERCSDPEYSIVGPAIETGGDQCSGFHVSRTYVATVPDGTSTPYSKQCVETWVVKDTERPQISAPDKTVACGSNNSPEVFEPYDYTATDNCENVEVTWKIKGENIPPSCSVSNDYTVKTYSLTFTALDKCSNSNSDDMTLRIQDKKAPAFDPKCSENIPIGCTLQVSDPGCSAADECALNALASPTNTCCLQENKLLRKWTVTDHCGNANSVSQTIQFADLPCSP